MQRVTALRNILVGAAVLAWATLLSPLLLGVSAWLGSTPAAATVAAFKPSAGMAVALLVTAALTAAAALLHKVRSKFLFVDYDHAHR